MVSIYDTELTSIKKPHIVTSTYLPVTSNAIITRVNGSLKRLIPLFDYETVENSNATVFKVLDDQSIIVNNSFTGKLLFTGTYNCRDYNPCFNTYSVEDIVCLLLFDEFGGTLNNCEVEVYISTDDTEYTYDSTITTDHTGQTNYKVTDEEITSIKFKYQEVYSNAIIC